MSYYPDRKNISQHGLYSNVATARRVDTNLLAPSHRSNAKLFLEASSWSLSQSGRSVGVLSGTDEGGSMEGLIDAVCTEHVQATHANQALVEISTCGYLNYISLSGNRLLHLSGCTIVPWHSNWIHICTPEFGAGECVPAVPMARSEQDQTAISI